jgi:hypothetical protein
MMEGENFGQENVIQGDRKKCDPKVIRGHFHEPCQRNLELQLSKAQFDGHFPYAGQTEI